MLLIGSLEHCLIEIQRLYGKTEPTETYAFKILTILRELFSRGMYLVKQGKDLLCRSLVRLFGSRGFYYTRNRITYNLRLLFWAGLMFFGNIILNFLLQSKEIHNSNNIFLTLACGILSLGIFFGFSKEKLEFNGRDKWIHYNLGTVDRDRKSVV